MNFFGHAMVAAMRSDEPRFVLGAMLPDLSSMALLRIETISDAELARGVALHHETDHAFHAASPFLALCASAVQTLESAGVARAAARAVGHVGSELLIDGLLSENMHAREAYAGALHGALQERRELGMRFKGEASPERLRVLLQRLAKAPLPEAYRDPDLVCERLYFILAQRPRLALQERDREPVQHWLRAALPDLARDLPTILHAVGC